MSTLYLTHFCTRRIHCIQPTTSSPVNRFRCLTITTGVMTLSTQALRRKYAIKNNSKRAAARAAANPSEATSSEPVVPKHRGRKPKALHHKKRLRLEKEESARVAEAARAKLRGHSSQKLIPLPTKPSAPSNHGPTAAPPKCPQPLEGGPVPTQLSLFVTQSH